MIALHYAREVFTVLALMLIISGLIRIGALEVFVRWIVSVFPFLSYDYRHRIKPRQVCPACGDRGPHAIKFEPTEPGGPAVALTCRRCSARWSYNPTVKAQKWVKPPSEE